MKSEAENNNGHDDLEAKLRSLAYEAPNPETLKAIAAIPKRHDAPARMPLILRAAPLSAAAALLLLFLIPALTRDGETKNNTMRPSGGNARAERLQTYRFSDEFYAMQGNVRDSSTNCVLVEKVIQLKDKIVVVCQWESLGRADISVRSIDTTRSRKFPSELLRRPDGKEPEAKTVEVSAPQNLPVEKILIGGGALPGYDRCLRSAALLETELHGGNILFERPELHTPKEQELCVIYKPAEARKHCALVLEKVFATPWRVVTVSRFYEDAGDKSPNEKGWEAKVTVKAPLLPLEHYIVSDCGKNLLDSGSVVLQSKDENETLAFLKNQKPVYEWDGNRDIVFALRDRSATNIEITKIVDEGDEIIVYASYIQSRSTGRNLHTTEDLVPLRCEQKPIVYRVTGTQNSPLAWNGSVVLIREHIQPMRHERNNQNILYEKNK